MDENDVRRNLPTAVTTRLHTPFVNAPIVLFEGMAIIGETDGPKERSVRILHEWTPNPVLMCRYSSSGEYAFHGSVTRLNEPISLEIPSLGIATETRYYDGQSCGDAHEYGLALMRTVEVNGGQAMSRIVYHVINCENFGQEFVCFPSGAGSSGRIEFETDEWTIILDPVENSGDLREVLRHNGGRAITHRLQLSRKDGETFDNSCLDEITNLVNHFIAFVTGAWAGLMLPIGYTDGEESWQLWNVGHCRPWANSFTWATNLPPKYINAVFPGFAARYTDEDWHEPFTQAIDWYIQCRNGTIETSVILGQAALELLSWVLYVEIGEIVKGPAGFENLWASDRIRLLLSKMLVNCRFPPKVSELSEFRFDGNQTYIDGPHAITDIRNSITHPKKQKRERLGQMGPLLRRQASELGLFYLECSLLGLSGYFGPLRADATCGALYSRVEITEPVYETADFSQLPGCEAVEKPDSSDNEKDSEHR